jgi:pimeloyl-ACP methyl ester carboxylesterase
MLHTTELGGSAGPGGGTRVVFCHGLFGQGRNFTGIGKALADRHRVTLVDMPDHGQSPWSDRFDYLAAADQVAELLSADDPVALVGHSMGGKISMLTALRHPELVERLVVVDVAPVPYDHAAEFEGYIRAMRAIDLDTLERRSEAEDALREAVPNPTVRGFLLQSLRREGDQWRWLLNLELLARDLDAITDWPEAALAGTAAYDGPVLWVGGADSAYVRADYDEAMNRWFPRNRRVMVKGAGHWVHSEQPEVFVEVLKRFLDH